MKNVREALARFHEVEENGGNAAKALDDLIKACDKYSFGRFRIFKRGRGRQRLDEVLEIRRRAEEVKAEKYSGTKYIHTDTSNEVFEKKKEEIKKRGAGKIIAAGLGALFGFTIGNIAKLLTLNPLWDKRGFNWKPGHYFTESMDFLDRTFGRTIEKEVEEPEIVKQPGGYGVKFKASAPSMHLIRTNVKAEVFPIVGSERQSEDIVK